MGSSGWKTGYITGGSSGIGYAIAAELCAAGTKVVLIARREQQLNAAAERLRQRFPGSEVFTLTADVADREAIHGALERAFAHHGVPDLLVNCAGTAYVDYFEQVPDEMLDFSLQVNTVGAWNVLKKAVPMLESGSQIVNVASVSGFIGSFGYTAYSAGKFALVGLSEALRNELAGRGIGVSVLCPPDTDTPQLAEEDRTKPPETRAVNGNVKLLQPEMVARVLFRGLRKGRFMIVPGLHARLAYWAKRLFPGLVFAVADRTVKKVQRDRREHKIVRSERS
jgi:short-subunit dehydrogenase